MARLSSVSNVRPVACSKMAPTSTRRCVLALRKAAELAVERKRLADERDRLAGGMAQAESPELEPEDGHRRGPRR